MQKTGIIPTLIEWDNDLPEFSILEEEAKRAAVSLKKAEDHYHDLAS